jgi:hypothetical protein
MAHIVGSWQVVGVIDPDDADALGAKHRLRYGWQTDD